jgi:lysylphosphatidylglycerol synthetase-like protein (DUF2156 family)
VAELGDLVAAVESVSGGRNDDSQNPRWARAGTRWLLALVRTYPLTASLLVLLWLIGASSGSLVWGPAPALVGWIGAGVGALRTGHWWFPLSSSLWCVDLGSYLATTALMIAFVPAVERTVRSGRALVLLLITQFVGVFSGVGAVNLLGPEAAGWTDPGDMAVGPVGAIIGMALAASAAMSTLWRRRLRVVLLVILAMLALYSTLLSDLLRFTTGLVGLGLGSCAWRPHGSRDGFSKPEVRVLVALIVAASALGPLIAAIAHTRVGPLSVLRYVFASPPPDVAAVRQLCADPTLGHDCARLQARLRLNGFGPAVMSAMPVVLSLAAAEGLRLGRRAAWIAALGLNVALTALGVVLAVATAASPKEQRLMIGPGHHVNTWLLFVLPLLQPVLVVVLLLVARVFFRVRAPAGTYQRWVVRLGVTVLGVSAIYLAGSILLADDYRPVPTVGLILTDLPTRFLPPGYLGGFEPIFLPIYPLTTVLYEWTGVVFWVVVVVGALRTFARTPAVTVGSRSQVRDLLATGGGSLSYPVTWSGNSYWFTDDHRAAIAYRVIGGVAVTTGGPIGDRASHSGAVPDFIRYCQDHGWIPCLYAVNHELAVTLAGLGWLTIQIGEEAVVPLDGLTLTGKRWQNVRTAMNQAARRGIAAEWCTFTDAPAVVTDQIHMISQQWLARKGVPEMRFTLGTLAELTDGEVRMLLAVDKERTVHAVTSWLPVRQNEKLVGYTLDVMRRRPESFNGIMDFLIGSAAQNCQGEGLGFLSLSGAPLARLDRGEPVTRLQKALDLLASALEPIYGFKSLFAFKARFHPRYEPLYLVYPDPVALPKIARAITRAYLPNLGITDVVQLTRRLVRENVLMRRGRGRAKQDSGQCG